MTKSLLSLALLASAGLMVQATTVEIGNLPKAQLTPLANCPIQGIESVKAPVVSGSNMFAAPASRGMATIDYTLSEAPSTFLGVPSTLATYAYAFEVSATDASGFNGCQVTQIKFYSGVSAEDENVNNVVDYTVFISTNLANDPELTQNCTASRVGGALNTITLDEPYTIKAGQRFYVGVRYTTTSTQNGYPIPVDYTAHDNDAGGWLYGPLSNGTFGWDNIASYYGFVCAGATIEGELPDNNATISGLATDLGAVQNQNFAIQVSGVTQGSAPLRTIEVAYTVGDQDEVKVECTLEKEVTYGKSFSVVIDNVVSNSVGVVPVNARITKLNGEESANASLMAKSNITVVPPTWDKTRALVIEEFTGTWCGWCPRGYVAMEKIRETYTDGSVIPLAIHKTSGSYVDPMNCSSYDEVVYNYVSGFPFAMANRTFALELSNNISNVATYRQAFMQAPALGMLDNLTADFVSKTEVAVSVDASFAFDINNSDDVYRLAFVVTEDNVGPYTQTNYYSGGQNGTLDGWEKYGSSVSVIYNDVVRIIDGGFGAEGSLPEAIEAGQTYNRSTSLKVGRTVNFENCSVTALLINSQTGVIEQGRMISSKDVTKSSINNVEATAEVTIVADYGTITVEGEFAQGAVYTPAGVPVASLNGAVTVELPAGLYIVQAGTTVKKVVVK